MKLANHVQRLSCDAAVQNMARLIQHQALLSCLCFLRPRRFSWSQVELQTDVSSGTCVCACKDELNQPHARGGGMIRVERNLSGT